MLVSELPDRRWYHLLVDLEALGLLSLIAMAISLGNRSRNTKAWRIVVTANAATVRVATMQRMTAKVLVKPLLTTLEYLMEAMPAPVIGNV